MLFECKCEFRGKSIKTNESGQHYFVSLETAGDDGEAVKFSSVSFDDFTAKDLKKGDTVTAIIDYSPIYKSLKVVDISKGVVNGK